MEAEGCCSSVNLQRQLHEVEALQSIYSGEGEFGSGCSGASISFTIHLKLFETLSVHFSFPNHYPETQAAQVSVRCHGNIPRQQLDTLNRAAATAAEKALGQESTLLVLQKIEDLAQNFQKTDQPAEAKPLEMCGTPQLLQRKLFWFHHIKSTRKRKCIVEWGKDLRVGGYCKPGFPGVLIIEAESTNINEYVKKVRQLRWQAMNLRALEEEQYPAGQNIDDLRRFKSAQVEELAETDMSKLAALCREASLEHLFLTALKLSTGH